MDICLQTILYAALLVVSPVLGAVHTGRCGLALEDIPDPASDSCVAFFRCYNNRQFSIRCPLGQAFHFDRARCRPEAEVDCPLQLQRFQAPAVPHYLRPNQAHHDREVEIRVVHVAPNTGAANNQVFNSGQAPVLRQAASQQAGQILTTGQFLPPSAQVVGQQAPVFVRTASGHLIQVQAAMGHQSQPQLINPPAQQTMAGQAVQGQHVQYPSQYNLPSQPVQGQNGAPSQQSIQGHTFPDHISTGPAVSGQAVQGQSGLPTQQNSQSQTVQGLNAPPAQQNSESGNLPPPPHQNARSQVLPNPPQVTQGQKLPANVQQNSSSQLEGQSNFAIFSPSSDGTAQSAGEGK